MSITSFFPNCSLHHFAAIADDRGALVALEAGRQVPFGIARVYYIYGTSGGQARGFHAHRALEQMAICVSGSCTMVIDDGRERRQVALARPDEGLYLGPMIWHEMHDISPDAVLLLLASAPYDEADYIRDYAEFGAAAQSGARA